MLKHNMRNIFTLYFILKVKIIKRNTIVTSDVIETTNVVIETKTEIEKFYKNIFHFDYSKKIIFKKNNLILHFI